MAANTLAYTITELRSFVGLEIGKNRTYSSVDAIGQSDIDKGIKWGLQQFYYPPNGHQWSFLHPTLAQLELHAAYETGTIAVASGVVTGTGTTFPTWAAQGDLWVSGAYYPVSSRASGTSITLVDTSVTVSSGTSYSLHHRDYTLPDDFGGLLDEFTYREDQANAGTLQRVNESLLRSMETYPRLTGTPNYFCLSTVVPTSAQESKQIANFYPAPDATYTLWYRYKVVPPLLDGSSYVYAHGGAEYSQTLLLSCLDRVLFLLYQDESRHQAFLEALEGSTRLDLRVNRPQTHGFGRYSDGYDRDSLGDRRRTLANFTYDTTSL